MRAIMQQDGKTSHLLALYPETVDLGASSSQRDKLIGIGGEIHPLDATPAFGAETIEKAAEIAIKEAHHRLNNRNLYEGHGLCLREGLWR